MLLGFYLSVEVFLIHANVTDYFVLYVYVLILTAEQLIIYIAWTK